MVLLNKYGKPYRRFAPDKMCSTAVPVVAPTFSR